MHFGRNRQSDYIDRETLNMILHSPALKYSSILSIGIIAGKYLHLNRTYAAAGIIILLIVLMFLLSSGERKITFQITAVLLIFATGAFRSSCDFYMIAKDSPAFEEACVQDTRTVISGTVAGIPDVDSNRVRFDLLAESITRGETEALCGIIPVFLRSGYDGRPPAVPGYGDKISVKGRLSEPAGERNEGEFDYRNYLFNKGIYKTFHASGPGSIIVSGHDALDFVSRDIVLPAREYSTGIIEAHLSGDEAEYLKGLVTGDRSDISEEIKSAFLNAGVTHLIAVSGLNVAYLILSLNVLLSLLRVPRIISPVFILLFLAFYCLLTGSSASIIRASVMGGLALVSVLIQRRRQFYNILGVSAMIILLADSRFLFDAGFILSFSATFSMVWIYEKFDKGIVSKISFDSGTISRIRYWLTVSLLTTLAAQIGTLPITVSYFGQIPLISIPVNIVAVPLANISLATGFLQIALSLISETASSFAAEANGLLLALQLMIIKTAAGFQFASFHTPQLTVTGVLLSYAFLIFIVMSNGMRQLLVRCLTVSMIICIVMIVSASKERPLEITVADVGQGDCILISTPQGRQILVDSGIRTPSFDSGERTISPLLRRKGISGLDAIILTHNHADHIGGAEHLLKNLAVGKVLMTHAGSDEKMPSEIIRLCNSNGTEIHYPQAGDIAYTEDGVMFYFLFPDKDFKPAEGVENLNNSSIVFLLKYKETEILFTGDAEKEAEEHLIRKYGEMLKADILKTGHHGSITSSSSGLIKAAMPQAAVVSCGQMNKFGHPSAEVLGRLSHAGAMIFRTDTNGGVKIETDGHMTEMESSYFR